MSKQMIEAVNVRIGDVLEVWWSPRRDTVTDINPYRGPLACMQGGWVFSFALLPSKDMTVDSEDTFHRLAMGGR